jgi:transposase
MTPRQALPLAASELSLVSQRLGPLPLVNHFVRRLRLDEHLDRYVPTRDRRIRLTDARGLGILLRSILVERDPIYRQQETVATYAPEAFGLEPGMVAGVGDDAIGRALDRLFDADRGSLLTAVVVAAGEAFELSFEELHNDSTTIRFCGQYTASRGSIRGKKAPWITLGYSKDHRPDLKQLLFVLTTTRDGGVPAQFRCEDGNTNDSRTHEQTWDALRRITGETGFLYVADSKLCSADAMDHIDRHGGRFVTVMPRSRREDAHFREWLQTHDPSWELAWDRPNPRRKRGPRDRWWTYRATIPSREGWPVIWVYSNLLKLRQGHRRQQRIARAEQELEAFDRQLAGKRPRVRTRHLIRERVDEILTNYKVARYLRVEIYAEQEHEYRQLGPGRPGPKTQYRRKTKRRWRLRFSLDEERIAYDLKSDGMYPLLTNDRNLSPLQVLEAHKRQPTIEKRFEQTKTVFELAPVLLKNPGRIEAFFFLYFLALLVQALIERELRRAMQHRDIPCLPLYPEERTTQRPTAEQILRLFSLLERHDLRAHGSLVRTFEPQLTPRQRQVLDLLGVPATAYRK